MGAIGDQSGFSFRKKIKENSQSLQLDTVRPLCAEHHGEDLCFLWRCSNGLRLSGECGFWVHLVTPLVGSALKPSAWGTEEIPGQYLVIVVNLTTLPVCHARDYLPWVRCIVIVEFPHWKSLTNLSIIHHFWCPKCNFHAHKFILIHTWPTTAYKPGPPPPLHTVSWIRRGPLACLMHWSTSQFPLNISRCVREHMSRKTMYGSHKHVSDTGTNPGSWLKRQRRVTGLQDPLTDLTVCQHPPQVYSRV